MVREPGKGSQIGISFEAFKFSLWMAAVTVVPCDDPRSLYCRQYYLLQWRLYPMEYRKVGNSGLKVSAISLGAWLTYGSDIVHEQTAMQCVRRAIESGVNFIDVADM